MTDNKSLYLQPETQEELRSILPMLTEQSVVLAGGTDLLPGLRQSGREPDIYLSLWSLINAKEISLEQGWLRIGAMVTHDKAACDLLVEQYFYALKMACRRVGSQQIRNKGTLCGSIANASPAGDILPCVFLYGGEIEITGISGVKRVRAEEFSGDNGKLDLSCREIITAIYLPVKEGLLSCFVKLGSRREVTIAQISMCAAWNRDPQHPEKPVNLKAFVGAVDVKPVSFDCKELPKAVSGDREACDSAAIRLRAQIQGIRLKRQRESKLKLTEAEKQYKERAAKGIIYELIGEMKKTGGTYER